ncbi:MAG: formylglycine-generating enzyme family protein [Myxococcota bacterium]|nr:formylglycine-generating enzyme family protein [Myxococcota bacterium]
MQSMSGAEVYQSQRSVWEGLIGREPASWGRERAQYISLLQAGQAEDFFALVSDSLPVFSSLFVLEERFLVFSPDLSLTDLAMRRFCCLLPQLGSYSDVLHAFWTEGAFDRLVARVFGGITELIPEERDVVLACSMRRRAVPAGRFTMGALDKDAEAGGLEKPVHSVTLSKGVSIGVYACTQALYEKVTGKNPSRFKGAMRPVERVSWCDAILFCNKLSEQEGLTPAYDIPPALEEACRKQRNFFDNTVSDISKGVVWKRDANGYRLPTEAEWEYCARAEEKTLYAGNDDPKEVAWYDLNCSDQTHPVAQKQGNAIGLYDMSGNVWEWVFDSPFRTYEGAETNPVHVDRTHRHRVYRGGSWTDYARLGRVSYRLKNSASSRGPSLGFRLVRSS